MTAAKQRAPARLLSRKAAVALRRILLTAPPPPNARAGEVAFKTGTSYGHRDAWAIGFDGRHVVGVWIGRADATAVPGLLGRTAAAPVLFDAFKRISPRRAPFATAGVTPRATAASDLPPPLRRFDRDRSASAARGGFIDPPVRILFPPDRAEIALTGDARSADSLLLKAEGGALPLTWLVDGRPVSPPTANHMHVFTPPGAGFVTVSVVDAFGRTARATVRLSQD